MSSSEQADKTGSKTDTTFNPIATIAASAAFFLACMDTLITNLALPTIQEELGASLAAQQWIVDGYTLPFAALLLLAGNLSDRFGAKRAFIGGTAGFALSSVICGLANSVEMLVFGRVVMGVAAAFILPSSMALINEAYRTEEHRRRALAVWGIGGSAATAAGPLLGGVLVPIHWSLVFTINIPVCLAVLVLCRKLATSPRVTQPIDFIGQVLALVALTCLVGGIIEGGDQGFTATFPLTLIVVGIIGVIAFLISQARVAHPMMPLSLLKPNGMRLALLGGFSMILSWNGFVFLCTLFLQQGLELSPLMAGLVFVPGALTSVAGNMLSDRLAGARGTRLTIAVGTTLLAIGYALTLIGAAVGVLSAIVVMLAVCLSGLGGGINTPSFAGLVLKSVDAEHGGIASAVFNTLRQVGSAIGIAAFGALTSLMPTMLDGMAAAFAVSVVLMALTLLVALRIKFVR